MLGKSEGKEHRNICGDSATKKTDEYTGIDPAPVVKVQPVAAKSSVQMEYNPVLGLSILGSIALFAFCPTPILMMIKSVAMAKLSFLPVPAAKAILLGGMFAVPTAAIYAGLKLLGKFTDIGECVVGGIYHTVRYCASPLVLVAKNFAQIPKLTGGLLSLAYGAELTYRSKRHSTPCSTLPCTYEEVAKLEMSDRKFPFVAASYIASAIRIIVGIGILSVGISGQTPTPFKIGVGMLSYELLNALYIVGRCVKERREAAQKVS